MAPFSFVSRLPRLWVAAWFAVAAAALVPLHAALPRITIANGEFRAGAQRIWINGVNTPWHAWDDFGGAFDAAWWDRHFGDLRAHGVNASRVWISAGGNKGIRIADDGRVSGATPEHWQHVDQLFEIAERHGVYVMATLMSFDHFKTEQPRHRKWRNWLGSDENIDSYVRNYVRPFVERYGKSPALWSIDLINEPDWVVEHADAGRIGWDRLQSYFARAACEIHARSPVLVTVGTAMPKYTSDAGRNTQGNRISDAALQAQVNDPGARLDFYSVHYYDWCAEWWGNALHQTPAEYGMPTDRPNVVGEFPAGGTQGHTIAEDYESAYQRGWQGAMGWTSNGVDKNGGLEVLGAGTRAFRDRHPELVSGEKR